MGANSNYLFYCLRIVANDTYPVAPPLVGMETVLNIIPSLQILENRAPVPEKKYSAKKSDIWQTKSVLINPSIVAQWDKLMKAWINSLRIGDIVDARDDEGEWYESVIRWFEVKDNRKLLYLHYIGRNKEWDTTIYADDVNRIAKRNTKTHGPYRARPKYRYPLSYSNSWMPK